MATSTTRQESTAVRGLGEIALRVNNLDVMQRFYEEVIGLYFDFRERSFGILCSRPLSK